jgi:hypothetical protein
MQFADTIEHFSDWMAYQLCELFHNDDPIETMDEIPSEVTVSDEEDNVTQEDSGKGTSALVNTGDDGKSKSTERTPNDTCQPNLDKFTSTIVEQPRNQSTSSSKSKTSSKSRASKFKAKVQVAVGKLAWKKIFFAALSRIDNNAVWTHVID